MAIVVIAGPSGTGKSSLAMHLALAWQEQRQKPACIVCADSITVYKGCDIGSAKPSPKDRELIQHHLLDLREPDQEFTAADFVRAADPILQNHSADNLVLLVGGTGFYLRALIQGMTDEDDNKHQQSLQNKKILQERARNEGMQSLYEEMIKRDPELREKIHPNDTYRIIRALQAMDTTGELWSVLNQQARQRTPKYKKVNFFCLEIPKPLLAIRLAVRTQAMIEAGFLSEVELLLERYPPTAKALQSVGYRECLEYLGKVPSNERPPNLQELAARITQNTLRLAKRQLTWFRSEKGVEWLKSEDGADFLPTLKKRLLLH